MNLVRLLGTGLLISALTLVAIACRSSGKRPIQQPGGRESVARNDINDVLRRHGAELMAIPGVVGVAVGLMDDEKTPCLKVLVVRNTEEVRKKLPKSIEGFAIVIEESGVIRPLGD
jgi:hypothetical protein